MTMPSLQTVSESNAWGSVLRRDEAFDGKFVYAVATTGIYCRPSCPSRRPNRTNVRFFYSAKAAERAGFRACQRCSPASAATRSSVAVQRARDYIDRELLEQRGDRITLDRVAAEAGLSPHHLQRRFKSIVGLTPAQYARAGKRERLKDELRRGATVSRAAYGAGYGSSSRVYESAGSQLGMTPATYQRGGAGAHIEYLVASTPFGQLLVAKTERGICAVTLGDDAGTLESALAAEYPAAERKRIEAPESVLGVWVSEIVASLDGQRGPASLPLDLQGTAFQWKVWRELQRIPAGETRSYSEVAAAIGAPGSTRAVASACAKNQVALVIPCHRVVRRGGELGGYRWGIDRKRELIENERAARKPEAS
jgi:AraC family transcriptional regulator, regulatory protein of adaptative response / methylated-DNA-[protein]-cysteine methyltransferase